MKYTKTLCYALIFACFSLSSLIILDDLSGIKKITIEASEKYRACYLLDGIYSFRSRHFPTFHETIVEARVGDLSAPPKLNRISDHVVEVEWYDPLGVKPGIVENFNQRFSRVVNDLLRECEDRVRSIPTGQIGLSEFLHRSKGSDTFCVLSSGCHQPLYQIVGSGQTQSIGECPECQTLDHYLIGSMINYLDYVYPSYLASVILKSSDENKFEIKHVYDLKKPFLFVVTFLRFLGLILITIVAVYGVLLLTKKVDPHSTP